MNDEHKAIKKGNLGTFLPLEDCKAGFVMLSQCSFMFFHNTSKTST